MTTLQHTQEVSKTKELGSRLATYNNALTLSVKLQHRGKIITSYAPLAVDRQQAINDSFEAEKMLKMMNAANQRETRQGYKEKRKTKHN